MTIRRVSVWGLVITVAISLACVDRNVPWTPDVPTAVTRLELEGPADVAPGQTALLRAMATFGTGGRVDVTDTAVWGTSSESVLAVTAPGNVAGRERGEATISATYSGIRALRSILVLEPGTYRITGRVLGGTVPVPGARVVVSRGIGSGLATTSGSLGAFALYGVAGDIDLTISQEGFHAVTRRLVVASHVTADVSLEPSEAPFEMTGDWILSVQAASSCRDWPAEANVRTYRASVTQSGPDLSVELRADRWIWGSPVVRIEGRIFSRTVTIEFPGDAVDGAWVQEQLPSGNVVQIAGLAQGTASSDGVAGRLSGEITLSTPAFARAGCTSADHAFRLARP